jgi:sugar (pentulose or hexulose) kinase
MRKEVSLGLDVGTSAVKYTAIDLSTGVLSPTAR